MHTAHRIIFSLLSALLLGLSTMEATPRLTVVVAVDGMHQQDLSDLRNYWPQGGLRTLSEEAFQTELTFPNLIYGGEEALTTLLSGTTPEEHGVAMNHYFRHSDRHVYPVFSDPTVQGIGTSQHLSPAAIRSMMLTDRFRLRYGEKAHIYAIGLHPYTTIALAGHAANACCWLDTESKQWVTTSYYPEGLPTEAYRQNTQERPSELAQREWLPRIDIAQYMRPTDEEKKKSFQYTGLQDAHSAVCNELIAELALAIQKDKQLGNDPTPDLLLLQMTVQSPKAKADHILSAEQEDMYLSVNQHIGYLMEQLDKRIGRQQYQLMVVGLPRLGESAESLRRCGLPKQEFNIDRAVALLGTYLMAIYGHERWIDGGYGNAIYINRQLIEQKKLNFEHICRQVSEFLLEFEGVQGACPATDLPLMHGSAEVGRLKASLAKQQRGDVVFWLQENWVMLERDGAPIDKVADRNPSVPLLLWSGAMRNYPDRSAVTALSLPNLLME